MDIDWKALVGALVVVVLGLLAYLRDRLNASEEKVRLRYKAEEYLRRIKECQKESAAKDELLATELLSDFDNNVVVIREAYVEAIRQGKKISMTDLAKVMRMHRQKQAEARGSQSNENQ